MVEHFDRQMIAGEVKSRSLRVAVSIYIYKTLEIRKCMNGHIVPVRGSENIPPLLRDNDNVVLTPCRLALYLSAARRLLLVLFFAVVRQRLLQLGHAPSWLSVLLLRS